MPTEKPTLTLEAIRKNPWNVLTHQLPPEPSSFLLEVAVFAAEYCADSEYMLMQAARDDRYTPRWWRPDCICPDAHEESEERGLRAANKRDEIRDVYAKIYGKIIAE